MKIYKIAVTLPALLYLACTPADSSSSSNQENRSVVEQMRRDADQYIPDIALYRDSLREENRRYLAASDSAEALLQKISSSDTSPSLLNDLERLTQEALSIKENVERLQLIYKRHLLAREAVLDSLRNLRFRKIPF